MTVAGNDITVGAVGEDLAFSHSPVLWVPSEFWQAAMHTDADGSVLLADHDVDGGVSLKEAFDGLPAYSSEQGSLKLIQGFLYAIAALVIIAFLTVWTMQRLRGVAITVALGGTRSNILTDAVGQALVVLIVGIAAGTLMTVGVGGFLDGIPMEVTANTTLVPAGMLLAAGLLGAGLSIIPVMKVDPRKAMNS